MPDEQTNQPQLTKEQAKEVLKNLMSQYELSPKDVAFVQLDQIKEELSDIKREMAKLEYRRERLTQTRDNLILITGRKQTKSVEDNDSDEDNIVNIVEDGTNGTSAESESQPDPSDDDVDAAIEQAMNQTKRKGEGNEDFATTNPSG